MATTGRSLALSPFLTGDPLRLEPPVASLSDLLAALGIEPLERPGFLPLAPRVALLHALTGDKGRVALRWVQLPHAPRLVAGAGPAEIVVVLTAPIGRSGDALRLASRLKACLRDPSLVERSRAVTTREGLVKILAAAEETVGESPVSGADLLALLDSGAPGLAEAEAALALLAFFWTYWQAGWRPGLPMAATGDLYRRATTMTLGGIVAAQVGNVFACRTDRESVFRVGLLSNRLVLLGIAAEVGILSILILVPPFPWVFGLAPLAFAEWKLLLFFPPVMLLLEEGRKWVVRTERRGGG